MTTNSTAKRWRGAVIPRACSCHFSLYYDNINDNTFLTVKKSLLNTVKNPNYSQDNFRQNISHKQSGQRAVNFCSLKKAQKKVLITVSYKS